MTCDALAPSTSFTSSANGQSFEGIYEFGDGEVRELSCKTVNCVYLLQCYNCECQYVGETVTELKARMSNHRGTTKPGKESGNFRLRQHYACSGGKCQSFKIFIIQKLAGTGRTDVKQPNSDKLVIDGRITKLRKEFEDRWIRTIYTMYPYGCNDRIDSLPNKSSYNCQFAKFISIKTNRKRSWAPKKSADDINVNSIVEQLLIFIDTDYHSSFINKIKQLLFPLKKSHLILIKDSYLESVFSPKYTQNDVLRKHVHFIIIDLLTYKINPYIINKCMSDTSIRKPKLLCKVDFLNKGVDMINLPRIFRNKELKSYVNFCNIKEPTVVYRSVPNISSKIFNYNDTVHNFIDINNITCMCSEYTDFINKDCNHVVTGDIGIFKSSKLRDILSKGPLYREPRTIEFEVIHDSILGNMSEVIQTWSTKESVPMGCFDGWLNKFKDLIRQQIDQLKLRYPAKIPRQSVFSDTGVKTELKFIHEHFVITPVDKAAKNIAIICKHYYISKLLNECFNSSTYVHVLNTSTTDICKSQKGFLSENKMGELNEKDILPHIVWFPKFHKPVLSQRFVVSYSDCTIKPLAKYVTLGLKAVYQQICSYSHMMFKVTGIKRNWIIQNNQPLLDCLNDINRVSKARNIQTYDFSTLYTMLGHEDIKQALTAVVKLAFRHSKKERIAIYSCKSFKWVTSTRDSTFYFDLDKLINCISYLIDNCYFSLGQINLRQIIGVPIGVSPGPYMANLTLWYYENKYMERLCKTDYFSAHKLNYTFRLIDDISSVNSDGIFEEHFKNIYPDNLILNKENSVDNRAYILDLDICINQDKEFVISVYDKRDDFPFTIVQFAPACSNQSAKITYGVFATQVLRYFRICNQFSLFEQRTKRLFKGFKDLHYDTNKLLNIFGRVCHRHKFIEKFNEISLFTLSG